MGTYKVPLDFEGVDDYDSIPAGTYPAVIEKLTHRPAKDASESSDGKPKSEQISVAYTVTDPEFEGRKLFQNLYLTPKALFRAARFFKAFGESYKDLEVDEETGIVLKPDLSGIAVEVKTFIDPYNDQNKVDDAPVPIGSAARAPRRDVASEALAATAAGSPRRGGRAIR